MGNGLVSINPYITLSLDIQDRIAHLRLNNPPVNVITVAMMQELVAALEQVEQRADLSVLVISGAGSGFSSGVDIAAHTPDTVRNMLVTFHSAIRGLVNTRKVTIAAVHGNCLGGGAELACVCDLVFTADDATWGFPEITLGCFPPVAAAVLASLIGQKRAADLILTGRKITGEEAMRIGLANEAASESEVPELVEETAERLASLSPATLATTKKALYAWDSIHFDKGLNRAEQIYVEELMKLDDAREGIAAWMEKREPKWSGR